MPLIHSPNIHICWFTDFFHFVIIGAPSHTDPPPTPANKKKYSKIENSGGKIFPACKCTIIILLFDWSWWKWSWAWPPTTHWIGVLEINHHLWDGICPLRPYHTKQGYVHTRGRKRCEWGWGGGGGSLSWSSQGRITTHVSHDLDTDPVSLACHQGDLRYGLVTSETAYWGATIRILGAPRVWRVK